VTATAPAWPVAVASWNIRAAIGPGEPFPPAWWRHVGRDRVEAIAAFIVGLDVDVVALQEVALGTVDGQVLDLPTELAKLTGMAARYAALHHYTLVTPEAGAAVGGVLWGNALLSRLPIRAAAVHALPVPADDELVERAGAIDPRTGAVHPLAGVRYADAGTGPREARCVLDCTVVADDRPIHILATHLTYVGEAQRRAQADAVARIATSTDAPVIVAGDLNAQAGATALEPLESELIDAFAATGTPAGDERRASCGPYALDHIFVRSLRPLACAVDRSAGDLSDHWPIRAVLASA
jgi:endonuclease/exonuclease/phosphatase family metal-dependent hydrolase